jgi:hypothetical protein
MDVYEQYSPFAHIMNKIDEGEAAIVDGRIRDGFEMIQEKKARYGV